MSAATPSSAAGDLGQLSTTIVRVGFLLGALDERSRRIIAVLLAELCKTPDDREDIAERIVANARVSNEVLDRKIKGPLPAPTRTGGRAS
jgi:hypothetical protein